MFVSSECSFHLFPFVRHMRSAQHVPYTPAFSRYLTLVCAPIPPHNVSRLFSGFILDSDSDNDDFACLTFEDATVIGEAAVPSAGKV